MGCGIMSMAMEEEVVDSNKAQERADADPDLQFFLDNEKKRYDRQFKELQEAEQAAKVKEQEETIVQLNEEEVEEFDLPEELRERKSGKEFFNQEEYEGGVNKMSIEKGDDLGFEDEW